MAFYFTFIDVLSTSGQEQNRWTPLSMNNIGSLGKFIWTLSGFIYFAQDPMLFILQRTLKVTFIS